MAAGIAIAVTAAVRSCVLSADEPMPVRGTVRVSGAPLASGAITFMPVPGPGRSAGAMIRDGRYLIPSRGGLPPGIYAVSITSPRLPGAHDPNSPVAPPAEETIPPEYNARTTLRRIIQPGREPVFDFDIRPAAGLPAPPSGGR